MTRTEIAALSTTELRAIVCTPDPHGRLAQSRKLASQELARRSAAEDDYSGDGPFEGKTYGW